MYLGKACWEASYYSSQLTLSAEADNCHGNLGTVTYLSPHSQWAVQPGWKHSFLVSGGLPDLHPWHGTRQNTPLLPEGSPTHPAVPGAPASSEAAGGQEAAPAPRLTPPTQGSRRRWGLPRALVQLQHPGKEGPFCSHESLSHLPAGA